MAAAVEIQAEKIEGKKGVEAFIRTQLGLVQTQLDGIRGKVRGQVAELRKTLGGLPQQTLETLKGAVKAERLEQLKGLLAKAPIAKVEQAVSDGVKLTEEAVQKLGLAKLTDVSALKDAFEGLQKKIEQLKKKVDGLTGAASSAVSSATKE